MLMRNIPADGPVFETRFRARPETPLRMTPIKLSSSAHLIITKSGVALYSDFGLLVLEGLEVADFAEQVVPLLDGTKAPDEIVSSFPHELRSNVEILLQLLDRRGLLERIEQESSNPLYGRLKAQQRFYRLWSDHSEELAQKIRESKVLIVGSEPVGIVAASQLAAAGIGSLHLFDDGSEFSSAALASALAGCCRGESLVEHLATAAPWCRVTTSSRSDTEALLSLISKTRWNLLIGAISPENLPEQLKWARIAHEANVRSLFCSTNGLEAFIGPLVTPGRTGCWNCTRLRMLANAECSWAAHALQQAFLTTNRDSHVRAALVPTTSLLGQLLSLEALKVLSGHAESRLHGHLMIQNLVTLETSWHQVIPMPWCEICCGAEAMALPDDKLSECNDQRDSRAGFHQSIAGWVDSRTGVISRVSLRKLDTLQSPSFFCAQALLSNYTEGVYYPNEFENCGGKGLTQGDAMKGAIGEAIERYSASRVRLANLLCSPLLQNAGDFLDPRALCLYEDSQYDERDFPFVRFDPSKPHFWARGHWLDNGKSVWVPALMTFYKFPDHAEDAFCQTTSNGLAAGVGLEDAALRAILELVERDAFMISWLGRRPGRRLMIDDGLTDEARKVVVQLEECGARLELYLLDAGLNIPVVACLGIGDGKSWPGLTVTSAAHLSPRTAVLNAILEHAYSGVYLRHLMLEGKHAAPASPQHVRNWNFLDHGLFYLPIERAAGCNFLRSDVDAIPLRNLNEPTESSLAQCRKRLASAGMRVAIVDVTPPDVALTALRVVRALAPNMQPIHCGYGLERLANPRLKSFLRQKVTRDIHPLC